MMIGAYEIAPIFCLDCGSTLKKPAYSFLELVKSTSIHVACECGCVYVWSWDETNMNGGIWKRRHVMPLFDDRARLEITPTQIKAAERRRIHNQKVNEAASQRLRERMAKRGA